MCVPQIVSQCAKGNGLMDHLAQHYYRRRDVIEMYTHFSFVWPVVSKGACERASAPSVCVCVLIISISRSTFRGRPRRICGTEAVFYSLLVRETERRSLSAGVVVFANVFGTFRKAVIVGRHPPIHPHVCPKTRRNHHHCRSSFFRVSQTQARARARPCFIRGLRCAGIVCFCRLLRAALRH